MRRVYVGRLNHHVREKDLERFFKSHGRVREILMKDGYAFVEFEHSYNAQDAVRELNGRDLNGDRVHVEFAKGTARGPANMNSSSSNNNNNNMKRNYRDTRYTRDSRDDKDNRDFRDSRDVRNDGRDARDTRRDNNRMRGPRTSSYRSGGGIGSNGPRRDYKYEDRLSDRTDDTRGDRNAGVSFYEKYGPPRNTDFRVIIENLSSRISWQNLKDHMRKAGEVTFADAHKRERNMGIVDFASYKDMKNAIETLDGTELYGKRIKVVEDKSRRGQRNGGGGAQDTKRELSRSRSRSNSRSRNGGGSQDDKRDCSRSRSRSRSRSVSVSRLRNYNNNGSNNGGPQDERRERSHSQSRSRSRSRSKSRINGPPPPITQDGMRDDRSRSRTKSRSRSRSRSESRSAGSRSRSPL